MKITSCGKSLKKLCSIKKDESFTDIFIIKRPEIIATNFDELILQQHQLIIIESKKDSKIQLRGQIEFLKEENQILFIGSPWFQSMEEVKSYNLHINDFAIHDPMIDLLPVLKTQEIVSSDITRLLDMVNSQKNDLKKFSLIASSTINGVVLTDSKGRIEWVNKAFQKITGYTFEEVKGKKPGNFLQGKDTDKETIKYLHKRIKNAEPFECEILNYTKENKPYWIKINGQPLFDDKGKVIQFFALEEDITLQKQNKEALERLSLVASTNTNGILFTDKKGKITWSNEGFSKLTGYQIDEMIGLTPVRLCKGPLSEKDVLYQMAHALINGSSFDVEVIHYRKDGTWFWGRSRTQPILDSKGEVIQFFSMVEDITQRKLADQALLMSEEKYKSIIDNMNLGLVEVDNDDKIQYVNQSFCEMSGYSKEELIGNIASEILLIDTNTANFIQEKNKIREKGLSDAYEISYTNKKGEKKWWLISGAPRYNDKNELLGSIGIHLDITAQKQLEENLKYAKKVAEESSNAKQIFLANMSHEIRTPMNAIIGLIQLLQKTRLDVKQDSYLSSINKSANILLSIINDILDFTKIEAGKMVINNSGFYLKELLEHATEILRYRSEEKGIELITYFDNDLPEIFIGDPVKLNQIITNLVGNAIKFTDEGKVELHCILLKKEKEKSLVRFFIKDTGIGIERDKIKEIFESFKQENESISLRYGGTGLGLSITKQLIELLGSNIQIESEKGTGTTFTFEMWFKNGSTNDIAIKSNVIHNETALKGKKILVVEDHEINRLLVITILENWGIKTDYAEDGLKAIYKLEKIKYDLVLMDVRMPNMNGLDATKQIRNKLHLDIPIIAMTANALKGDTETCLAAGMNDYISKPFQENDLYLKICSCLNLKIENLTVNKDNYPENKELFSKAKLEQISRGNKEFVNKMLQMFADSTPSAMDEILNTLKINDVAKLKSLVHKLKPSILTLEIMNLEKPIHEIEKNNSTIITEEISNNIQLMDKTIKEVITKINSEIN